MTDLEVSPRPRGWIVPAYLIGSAALAIVCWYPLLYGQVDSLWVSAGLGILSGAPVCVAIPFVLHRLLDGMWVWQL